MRQIIFLLTFCLFVPSVVLIANESNDTYRNRKYSFKISKPSSWIFQRKEDFIKYSERFKLKKEDEEKFNKAQSNPLVIISKYKEPYNDINPTFQITASLYNDEKKIGLQNLLAMLVHAMNSAFEDFKVIKQLNEVTIDNSTGYSIKFIYNVTTLKEKRRTITTKMVLIKKNNILYIIKAMCSHKDKIDSQEKFEQILNSFRFVEEQ